jgi:type IV secretion system protein VirB10
MTFLEKIFPLGKKSNDKEQINTGQELSVRQDDRQDDPQNPNQDFDMSPEDATNFAPQIKRKNTMMILTIALSVIVMTGVVFSSHKKKSGAKNIDASQGNAAHTPQNFLRRELENARQTGSSETIITASDEQPPAEQVPPAVIPDVEISSYNEKQTSSLRRAAYQESPPIPPPPGQPAYSGNNGYSASGGQEPPFTAHVSPLVPIIEGGGFQNNSTSPKNTQSQQGNSYTNQFPYSTGSPPAAPYSLPSANDQYAAQNNQAGKKDFHDSGAQGALSGGYFLADNAIWPGSIIPAVLETAVNTDLPGNIIARTTSNVYDSRTGKLLLIPQGTLLVAKYNSSVSYAQKRVQIVWNTLIRPDGFKLELENMNAVDRKGRSGSEAEYHENWFEYLKAAGLITMFSIANSKMAEDAAKYGGQTMAQGVTQGNAEFINQVGGNIVSRATNIQPTLTVDSGEKLNIMTNKTIYLPPLDDYPVTAKYTLP